MRRKTLRDFSISSERKLEHRGGWAGGNGQNLIYFRSFHKFFFHGRMVVLIFQLPDWGIIVLDHIRVSTQLPLCKWYPSPKQWIHSELKPIPVLKWGLSVLWGMCAVPEHLIMVLPSSKRENDTRPVQRLKVLCLNWMHWLLRLCVGEQWWEKKGWRKFDWGG